MLAIAGCLAAATAAAEPVPEAIAACAERIAREPACALDLALDYQGGEKALPRFIMDLAKEFEPPSRWPRNARFAGVDPQAPRRAAEDWILTVLDTLPVAGDDPRKRKEMDKLWPTFTLVGMPRAAAKIGPDPTQGSQKARCAIAARMTYAYAIADQPDAALAAAREALALAPRAVPETEAEAWSAVLGGCPPGVYAQMSVYFLLSNGRDEAAIALQDAILAATEQRFRKSLITVDGVSLRIPPDSLRAYRAAIDDDRLTDAADRMLVRQLTLSAQFQAAADALSALPEGIDGATPIDRGSLIDDLGKRAAWNGSDTEFEMVMRRFPRLEQQRSDLERARMRNKKMKAENAAAAKAPAHPDDPDNLALHDQFGDAVRAATRLSGKYRAAALMRVFLYFNARHSGE